MVYTVAAKSEILGKQRLYACQQGSCQARKCEPVPVGNPTSAIVRDTLRVALEENSNYIMYTPPAFTGSTQARSVLDTTMLELALRDRAAVNGGTPADEFLTDEHFELWYNNTFKQLQACCK